MLLLSIPPTSYDRLLVKCQSLSKVKTLNVVFLIFTCCGDDFIILETNCIFNSRVIMG